MAIPSDRRIITTDTAGKLPVGLDKLADVDTSGAAVGQALVAQPGGGWGPGTIADATDWAAAIEILTNGA